MQENTRRPSEDRGRRGGNSISGMSDSTLNASQSNTAASAVIIPNKSTITEEEIEVPYGRDPARESTSTALDDGVPTELEPPDSASDYPSPMSPRSPPVTGLNALGARLMAQDSEPENEKSADDYYDKYGRAASAASDRSGMGSRMANLGNSSSSRNGPSEDTEQMRKDYEFKIANMQTQIATLERKLGDAEETEKKWREGEAKARQLEEDLAGLRRVITLIVPSPLHTF
jgi:protein SPA2